METLKKAIIAAAGMGNRLHPVTLETPKPLVRVNGVRMIDTQILALKENGIHEIYIVTGYKEELFRKAFADDPEIHIISNPYYTEGNNITSLYVARNLLPGSFVLEGDLMVRNCEILNPCVKYSGYCATPMDTVPKNECALHVENERIISCNPRGNEKALRLWGISMWTETDGKLLSLLLEEQFEEKKNWQIYWDELALFQYPKAIELGVRTVQAGDLTEIDSLEELVEIDATYASFL